MMGLIQRLLDLLYPPKCVFCGKLLQKNETDLCKKCRFSLPEAPNKLQNAEFFKRCWAVYEYDAAVRESILRYKFSGMQQYSEAYGKLIAMKLLREHVSFDVLTWVPISEKRKRKRGYDQGYLLANAVAKEMGTSCVRTLRKTTDNRAQASIGGVSARKANVLGVYEAYQPERFRDQRILLIDDVITTGATLSECSRVLLTAGASQVDCAALAATQISDRKKQ